MQGAGAHADAEFTSNPSAVRNPTEPTPFLDLVRQGYSSDPWLSRRATQNDLLLRDGIFLKEEKVAAPDTQNLRQQCVVEHHSHIEVILVLLEQND